ncbi:MAG: hypothetical protein JWL80_429 [Parcubacteria group bacterium]|nr:hypothetical protein [Parcubacteria group bacterium]
MAAQIDDLTVRRARKAMRHRIKQTSLRAMAEESGLGISAVAGIQKPKTSLHHATKVALVKWYKEHIERPIPSKEDVNEAIDVIVRYAGRSGITRAERHDVLRDLIRQTIRRATALHI